MVKTFNTKLTLDKKKVLPPALTHEKQKIKTVKGWKYSNTIPTH